VASILGHVEEARVLKLHFVHTNFNVILSSTLCLHGLASIQFSNRESVFKSSGILCVPHRALRQALERKQTNVLVITYVVYRPHVHVSVAFCDHPQGVLIPLTFLEIRSIVLIIIPFALFLHLPLVPIPQSQIFLLARSLQELRGCFFLLKRRSSRKSNLQIRGEQLSAVHVTDGVHIVCLLSPENVIFVGQDSCILSHFIFIFLVM
jgi:hypothetical protein